MLEANGNRCIYVNCGVCNAVDADVGDIAMVVLLMLMM